jgi:hypothetical protein
VNDLVLTPGRWRWRQCGGSVGLALVRPSNGLNRFILDARRSGNGATIRLAHRTSGDLQGTMRRVPIRLAEQSDYLDDEELTPDALLIQMAPALLEIVERVLGAPESDRLPAAILADAILLVERITPSQPGPRETIDEFGLSIDDTVCRRKDEREKLASLGLVPEQSPTAGGAS